MSDYRRGPHPDLLDAELLVGRVQGDAIQLAGLVRDVAGDVLQRLFDAWGPDHVRRVAIALAAAVDDSRTPQELWGWLGEPVTNRMSTTIEEAQIWKTSDPWAPPRPPRARHITDETRVAMADRARALNGRHR